jgi:ribose 5-phosphate isomerase B
MDQNVPRGKVTIAVGSDHAGFALKTAMLDWLSAQGYTVKDFGTFSLDPVDYPDIAQAVGRAIAAGEYDRGMLICGTGIGMSITANKVRGIRAAACSEPYSARMSRAHNNANVLCIGGRVVGIGLAEEIAQAFFETDFEFGSRHERRVEKMMETEGKLRDRSRAPEA